MTAKEYLSQAYRLDLRIQSKKDQIASLESIAMNCTPAVRKCPITQALAYPRWQTPSARSLTLKTI